MIFFLDENFPKKAYDVLISCGYQVIDIRGTKDEGLSDTVIFEKAIEKSAVFLTTDKDFYHTIPILYPIHPGIIVIALSQPNGVSILLKLQKALELTKTIDLHNRTLLVTDKNMMLSGIYKQEK